MKRQLISLAAITVLAVNAQAAGSSATWTSEKSVSGADSLSTAVLTTSTSTVELSGKILEKLHLDSRLSKNASTASTTVSTSTIGEDNTKGLRGSLASATGSVIAKVASAEEKSVTVAGNSVTWIEFQLSNEQGSVRVSAAATSRLAVSAYDAVKEVVTASAQAGSAMSVAVSQAGAFLIIETPSNASQAVSEGRLGDSSEMILLAPSKSVAKFSTTLEAEAAKMKK